MDCEYELCHLSNHCRLKEVAHNCAIHKKYLKAMKGEIDHSGIFADMNDEESIRRYVKKIEKMYPHLTQRAEENAREILDSINH